jgi:hypothetical protein
VVDKKPAAREDRRLCHAVSLLARGKGRAIRQTSMGDDKEKDRRERRAKDYIGGITTGSRAHQKIKCQAHFSVPVTYPSYISHAPNRRLSHGYTYRRPCHAIQARLAKRFAHVMACSI